MVCINNIDSLNIHPIYKEAIIKTASLISTSMMKPDEVWLFGSCARGNVKVMSDIDIAIIYNNHSDAVEASKNKKVLCLLEDMWIRGELPEVNAKILTVEMVESNDLLFYSNIRRDRVVLYRKEE